MHFTNKKRKAQQQQWYQNNQKKRKLEFNAWYQQNQEAKILKSKVQYQQNQEAKKLKSKVQYQQNQEAKKLKSKVQYQQNQEAKKLKSKVQYQQNQEAKKLKSKVHYQQNQEAKKLKSKVQYQQNQGAKKLKSKVQYQQNQEAKKLKSKVHYQQNQEAKKLKSKVHYQQNQEAKKLKSKIHYQLNQETKKFNSKVQYQNYQDARKGQFKSWYFRNKEAKKLSAKRNYQKSKNSKIASVKKRYQKKQTTVCKDRRDRYTLAKFNVDRSCVKNIQHCIESNTDVCTKLINKFVQLQPECSKKVSQKNLIQIVTGIAARSLINKCLCLRKKNAGGLLKCVRNVRQVKIDCVQDFGEQCHTIHSEPFFYDSAYCMTKHLLIPVNDDGKCVIVEPDKRENKKLTWKCSIECKPLLQDEIDAIVSLKEAFSGNIKVLRQNLAKIDINCPNEHYFKKSAQPTDKRLRGHPLVCHGNDSECKSTLRILRSVSSHYKQLRKFLKLVYKALKYDFMIHCIDNGLHFTDVTLLMKLVNVKEYESLLYKGEESDDDVDGKHAVNVDVSSILRDPYLEDNLHIDYVELMNNFQKEVDDYPINICCCCEQLHQKVNVSVVKFTDHLDDTIWPRIKKYLLENNPNADSEIFYICNYCKPKVRAGKLPPQCVLNGLKTESIPVELTKLDSLSCQLIQKAKCYQTIVRLGTYTAKVPTYNSLKACSGAMFFLPLPMSKTLATLDEVKGSLPNPELYVILNGQPTKDKVVWRSLVNVDKVKLAVQKLKDINWIYKDTDVDSVDDATKEIVEVTTDSTMLEKATKEEIVGFQMFTIRNLDNKLSTECDIDQYKVLNIREQPISNRQKYLDVMCFPTLFPTGQFGEYYSQYHSFSQYHCFSSDYDSALH